MQLKLTLRAWLGRSVIVGLAVQLGARLATTSR